MKSYVPAERCSAFSAKAVIISSSAATRICAQSVDRSGLPAELSCQVICIIPDDLVLTDVGMAANNFPFEKEMLGYWILMASASKSRMKLVIRLVIAKLNGAEMPIRCPKCLQA